MKVYALRDKNTKLYLPWGKHARNNSRENFTTSDKPRIFNTKKSASNARTAWLAGIWRMTGGYINYTGEYDSSLEPRPVTGRIKENIEIVTFELIEIESLI